ncbi:MAG: YlxR family protein [Clostridiales bacterium]|nr:YlxR family protein [Clostridiales bacterium]
MPKKIPMRMCVGCREMKPKKELLRIVRTPDGEILLDPTGKKSGRGAYVCRQEACLMRAIKQRQLDRSLEATIGPAVTEQLRETLAALPKEAAP